MMDSRERVLTAIRGDEPDRLPCALGFFSQQLYGAADADELFGTDVRFVDLAPPAGQDGFLQYLESLPPGVHVGSAAQLRTYHEWGYHPERPEASGRQGRGTALTAGDETILGVRDRLAGLMPRLTQRSRYAHLRSQVERLHARGLAVAASPPHLGGELFESAWRLRGFESFMRDMVKRPESADYLLDQLEAMATESARILARAGVDVLILDDDVAYNGGLLISPAMWRRYFKPRMGRIIGAAREAAAAEGLTPAGGPAPPAVLYHCDGDFTGLLGDLIEIGVDAVNPLAPDAMDAARIRRAYGERLAFWGTVGTPWTWDTGTPEDLRREVTVRIATLGRKGLLLCPAYDLDFAPRGNVAAFVQAVREFG